MKPCPLSVAPAVERLARRLYRKTRGYGVTLDDLRQQGHLGVLLAARTFDDRGTPWGLFAERRAWGAMLDYLRSLDTITRHSLGKGIERPRVLPLLTANLHHDPRPRADELLDDVRQLAAVRAAVLTMRPQAQRVYQLLYVEELTQDEAGARLGVSGSRVCQIVREIERHLTERLQAPA